MRGLSMQHQLRRDCAWVAMVTVGGLRRHGVRMHIVQLIGTDENRMGRHTQVGVQILGRLAILEHGQRHHAFAAGTQGRRVQLDRVRTIATLLRFRRRLGHRIAAALYWHLEAHHLLAKPARHGIGIDVIGARPGKLHRDLEATISAQLGRVLMDKAGEMAVGRQHMKALGQFFVKLHDRLPGGLVGKGNRQLTCQWAGFFDDQRANSLFALAGQRERAFDAFLGCHRRHCRRA